jgi:hypothetical protein
MPDLQNVSYMVSAMPLTFARCETTAGCLGTTCMTMHEPLGHNQGVSITEEVTKIQCCTYHKISDPFTNVNCKSVKIWSKARNRSKDYEGKYLVEHLGLFVSKVNYSINSFFGFIILCFHS